MYAATAGRPAIFEYRRNKRPIRSYSTLPYPSEVRQYRIAAEAAARKDSGYTEELNDVIHAFKLIQVLHWQP
jgi:hypothetical protein